MASDSIESVYLPRELHDGLSDKPPKGQQVAALIEIGLTARASLPVVARMEKKRLSCRVSKQTDTAIEKIRGTRGLSPQETRAGAMARLAWLGYLESREETRQQEPEKAPGVKSPKGRSFRPEQLEMIQIVQRARSAQRVALVEGSTGTGKGLAMAAAATDAFGNEPVVIAVPTHMIGKQIVDDLLSMGVSLKHICALKGRREFVSQMALLRLLATNGLPEEVVADVSAWMKAQKGGGLWLAAELQEEVPDLPLSSVIFYDNGSPDDAGWQAYLDHRSKMETARVIVCTHTMLALDTRARLWSGSEGRMQWSEEWGNLKDFLFEDSLSRLETGDDGLIPAYGLLLIDEVHQLEGAFAQIMSAQIPLSRMRACLKAMRNAGVPGAATAYDQMNALFNEFMSRGRRQSGEVYPGDVDMAVETATKIISNLKPPQGRRRSLIDPEVLADFQDAQKALTAFKRAKGLGIRPELSWSPKYFWPSITLGPKSVSNLMGHLWTRATVNDGAAGFSATIFVPSVEGRMSDYYMRSMVLSIPDRAYLEPPTPSSHRFTPKWVFSPLKIQVAQKGFTENAMGLLPPKKDELQRGDIGLWLDAQSLKINQIAAERPQLGGVLVLCTSYLTVDGLMERLLPHMRDRLLCSSRGSKTANIKARFIEMSRAGLRPVWLGVGACWTGLDLSDPSVEPAEDRILTDVIIPKLPINTLRSTTQTYRAQMNGGFHNEIRTSLLVMRQGMGRLVRRKGVDERRIWILDPRIMDVSLGWNAPFRALMSEYAVMSKVSIMK